MSNQFLQISGLNNQFYEQQSGIILDDKFITKEDFRLIFKQLLETESDSIRILKDNLIKMHKIRHITQSKKGKVQKVTEFLSDLEYISQLFSTIVLKGFGGQISLLSTFNMTQGKKVESYFLMNEDELPSRILPDGAKKYINTQQELSLLLTKTKQLQKLNQTITSHLNGFNTQLRRRDLQTKEERMLMYQWAYYQMKERYWIGRETPHPISIAKYFWGHGQTTGFIHEAFGTHLALHHPDVLKGGTIMGKLKSVIAEHGGPGSHDLFTLLHSTKGNTMSQLSGDTVGIDGNGYVIFNIQSKASRKGDYEFTIKYQKFIQNLYHFIEVFENSVINGVNEKDIDALFAQFSTKAWVPIKENAEKEINTIANTLIKGGLKI